MKNIKRNLLDPAPIECNVTIDIHNAETGDLIERRFYHNMVTVGLRNLIRDLMNGDGGNITASHFALGTGSTNVTGNETTLEGEVFRDAVTKKTKDATKLIIQYYLSSTTANGNTLRKAGLFNAASNGTLLALVKIQDIVKTVSITATFTWEINYNA